MGVTLGRLQVSIIVSMVGWLADYSITQWMLTSLTGFSESNTNLLPQIGLPLLVLNFILADHILPRRVAYDRFIYTMALLQWSGPVQNILVLFRFTSGLNYFATVLPFMGITYLVLHFGSQVGERLRVLIR